MSVTERLVIFWGNNRKTNDALGITEACNKPSSPAAIVGIREIREIRQIRVPNGFPAVSEIVP